MARGAKPGQRRGGRAKGTPNKTSVEQALIAERVMKEAAMSGRKLGKEMLEEFAVMFGGLMAATQPIGTGPNHQVLPADVDKWIGTKKEDAFERYAKLALKAASELADFQSPRMGTVQVPAPPPDRGTGKITKKFTINIFDNQGRPAPRHITVKPNSSVTAPQKLN